MEAKRKNKEDRTLGEFLREKETRASLEYMGRYIAAKAWHVQPGEQDIEMTLAANDYASHFGKENEDGLRALISGSFCAGVRWADAHPNWHTMDELPEKDPTMVSRGFNMSLPVLLCDVENLTAYAGARYHYDPARYNFDKKQWEDIIGYCDEEIGITHTHWMYQPEPPKVEDPTEQTLNQTF